MLLKLSISILNTARATYQLTAGAARRECHVEVNYAQLCDRRARLDDRDISIAIVCCA